MTIDPGAFELRQRSSGALIGLQMALAHENGRTVVVVTFHGAGIVGGSLGNGQYDLVIRGDKVRDQFGQLLDGDNDGAAGGNHHEEFFRRFGDGDGDGDVDLMDRVRFSAAVRRRVGDPGYRWYYDWNDDGLVAMTELLALTVGSGGPHR